MLVGKSITAEGVREETWSVLESLAREGARKLLQQALENEVEEYIEAHAAKRDENGHRLAVRNGGLPERSILTGMGPMAIRQPRVDDRKLKEQEGAERFSSQILPRYLRRVPSVDNLIPSCAKTRPDLCMCFQQRHLPVAFETIRQDAIPTLDRINSRTSTVSFWYIPCHARLSTPCRPSCIRLDQ